MQSIYLTFSIEGKQRTVGLLITGKSSGAGQVTEFPWQALGVSASTIFDSTSQGGSPRQPTGKLSFSSAVGADIKFAGKVVGRINGIRKTFDKGGSGNVYSGSGNISQCQLGQLNFDWSIG